MEVVDDDDTPLPCGELGRVRVLRRGSGPAEYLDDPKTTARHFRDDWFYPGDLGVLDAVTGDGAEAQHGQAAGERLHARQPARVLDDRVAGPHH